MHIKLSEKQVLEIYSYRPLPDGLQRSSLTGRSSELSRLYGISTKAIRDIWNLRSWAHVTQRYDQGPTLAGPTTGEPLTVQAVRQPPGRPMMQDATKPKSRKRSRSTTDPTTTREQAAAVLLDVAKRHATEKAVDAADAPDMSYPGPAAIPNIVFSSNHPPYTGSGQEYRIFGGDVDLSANAQFPSLPFNHKTRRGDILRPY
eukprot:CAMPEP_0196730582 /NCGR_PEP_ID=MMETSP1091-20130531/10605_1 /TAXON_ID=302021 /ORGANISM="Rhodomonas sp., Strain CCMP768" /LENGTH=201 /DNA_ID=CAMNT_0042073613 /DNA_START=96 /DNA_END=700 /DNA_ORIENTATION=+